MIIETLSWGELEVSEEQTYSFPKGIPGFEEETSFALIAMEGTPFWYLQSMKEKGLSFLLGDPFPFFPSYEFELPEDETEELGVQSDVIVRCIITLKEQTEKSTINLLAPIVFNPVNRKGKQVILHKSTYGPRHNFLPEQSVMDGKDSD